jgi:hypothetical protein
VYVELQALESSQADKYLILAGKGYVIARSALVEAIRGREAVAGGDLLKSMGVKLSLEELEEVAEQVIFL